MLQFHIRARCASYCELQLRRFTNVKARTDEKENRTEMSEETPSHHFMRNLLGSSLHSFKRRTSSSLLSIDPRRPRKKNNEKNEVQNYTRPYRLTSVKRICNPKLKLREMKLTSFY